MQMPGLEYETYCLVLKIVDTFLDVSGMLFVMLLGTLSAPSTTPVLGWEGWLEARRFMPRASSLVFDSSGSDVDALHCRF